MRTTCDSPLALAALAALAAFAAACAEPPRPLQRWEKQKLEGGGPLEIVKFELGRVDPGHVLRRTSAPVTPDDAGLPELIEALKLTLEKSGGVGLAAPQV